MIHTVFRRLRLRLGFLFPAVFSLTAAASAQDATGSITGRVIDDDTGRALQGAIVRVVGTDLRAETGRDGYFLLRNVPAGEQRIEAAYVGATPRTLSVPVAPDGVTPVNFNFGEEVVELEKLTVTAEAMGQARAVNQQRVADAMVNITSEELFGEATDNNLAKALQRIPGISVNSDGGTEIPRFVNIRGFAADLNSVQLNGSRLPSTNDGTSAISAPARGFALDDLPASAVTSIEVVKAPTADMDGDAVGGIVNLVTKSAFDRNGRAIDFNIGMDYISLREEFVPHIDLGYSDLLQDGRLGVSLNLSYYQGNEGFDNIDYDWLPLAAGQPQNGGYGLTDSSVFFHEDSEYNTYLIERDRYSFAASLDYKLTDTTTVHFKPVYTYEKRLEDDRRFHKIMDNDHGRPAPATAVSGPTFAATPVGGSYNAARGRAIKTSATAGVYSTYESVSRVAGRTTLLPNGTGRGSAGYRQSINEIEPEFYSLDFGGESKLGWGDLKYGLFYSDASRPEIRDSVRFDRNGLQWAYDRPDMLRPEYRTINGLSAEAIPTAGSVDYFINPSSSNLTRQVRETNESALQTKLDLTMPFREGTGINGTFKTGVKFRAMDREHDRNSVFYNIATAARPTYDFTGRLKESDFTVSGFDMPYFPDTARILGEALGGDATYTRDTSNARRVVSLASDYEANEDSYEGYVMSVLDVGSKLTLTPGVRIEHTMFSASTPVYDATNAPLADRAPTTEKRDKSYTQVLPGFHVRYEASDNVVFRTAYTHTYARPSFRELIAVTTFDEVNNIITTGNPDLDPYTSKNWDISAEYFGPSSYFQAALFHKKVEGQVLETGETISGVSDLRGLALNPAETYTVTTFANQHNSTNWGLELVGRYRFTGLPKPFDGLYLDSSVTYTDSNGNYADRPGEKLPTYGGSEWLYFIGLGYQNDRFAALLSYRYRSPYLEGLENVDRQNRAFGLGPDVGDDWWGEERFLNLETSYRVTDKLRVYCNITNLAEFTNYSTQSPYSNDYPEDSYWHKMRISFGLKGSF